jgi:hypothetical protein
MNAELATSGMGNHQPAFALHRAQVVLQFVKHTI